MNQLITIKDVRNQLADVINQVAIGGNVFTVTKFGKPKAMIVPIIKAKTQKSVFEETFGAWKGRKDIKNTAKWVANLRAKMSIRQ